MTQLIRPSEKIILALDGMDKDQSIALLDKLPDLLWVKIGLELFVSAGPTLVNDLREKVKKKRIIKNDPSFYSNEEE